MTEEGIAFYKRRGLCYSDGVACVYRQFQRSVDISVCRKQQSETLIFELQYSSSSYKVSMARLRLDPACFVLAANRSMLAMGLRQWQQTSMLHFIMLI